MPKILIILHLTECSTLGKTNMPLIPIRPKSILLFHECKVVVVIVVVIIIIFVFINKVSYNISKNVSSLISPILQPSILLFCCLIKAILSFKSFITLVELLSESLHLESGIRFWCCRLVIFQTSLILKKLIGSKKIYPHNSHVSYNSRLLT